MDLLNTQAKQYLGFEKLKLGYHEIERFKLAKNRYYKPKSDNPGVQMCLTVELDDQVLYLPEHISRQFDGQVKKVEELNKDGVKKFLYYGGTTEK